VSVFGVFLAFGWLLKELCRRRFWLVGVIKEELSRQRPGEEEEEIGGVS
jgi:hypothetical protein